MNIQTCQNCWQANPPGKAFCSNCGQQLAAGLPNNFGQQNFGQPPNFNQQNNFGAPVQSANKKSPLRIIVAVFMVFAGFIGLCGGIAKLSSRRNGQTRILSPAPVSSSSAASQILGKWRNSQYGDLNFGTNGRYTETLPTGVEGGSYDFSNGLNLRLKPDNKDHYIEATATVNNGTLTLYGKDGIPIVYTR